MEHPPHKSSRRVPGHAIRNRRGEARGFQLSPLDGTLLHCPPLLRNQGALPGDIRELMILRVAAINNAAFEWIHHEPVARTHGLDTAHTRHVKVADSVIEELRSELGKHLESKDGNEDDLLAVPWPLTVKKYGSPTFDSCPSVENATHTIHAITLVSSPSAPWLVFANSLLTDYSMWAPLIPYLLPSGSGKQSYNLLLHSQRGHGLSTCAPATTISSLASDIAHVITRLSLKLPVQGVIGVSQGGAAALAFAAKYAHMTKSVVVCDTAAQTPSGNQQAWEALSQSEYTYAEKLGMGNLASVTIERWFPKGSRCSAGGDRFNTRARALGDYDLIKEGLMESAIEHVLFVWGSLDGAAGFLGSSSFLKKLESSAVP
ncbi:Alpha/Beta hydrolase protein [Infundibulicybe gibba]|nr:Alpha/Beta hydrolase protein [Infundibulicybe gibba]